MSRARTSIAVVASTLLCNCGGGVPLMHPAHTLPAGEVTMGGGVSGQFAVGEAASDIDAAREVTAQQGSVTPGDRSTYLRGAVVHTAIAPGVAPWVGARAGIGFDADAGLSYLGRTLRVDGRRAFIADDVALSVGLAGSGLLNRNTSTESGDASLPGLDATGVRGWGVDVPVLVGLRSTASLIQIYAGLRAGYEHIGGEFRADLEPNPEPVAVPVNLDRYWGAALVGLAVSVEPLMGIVEVSGAVHRIDGSLDLPAASAADPREKVEVTGLSLTPSAALVARF